MQIDTDPYIIAAYPYVLTGSLLAAVICGWSAWRLRNHNIKLWWLLVGITVNMAFVVMAQLWWLAARAQTEGFLHIADWMELDQAMKSPVIPIFTMGMAFGAWIHVFAALAVNWRKDPIAPWIRKALLCSAVFVAITYPLLVLFLAGR